MQPLDVMFDGLSFSILTQCRWKHFGFSKSQKTDVNCWFCNGNFKVENSEQEHWTCPSCEQYNGFDESGDYNRSISDVFESNQERVLKSHPQSAVNEPSSVLCRNCNENQTLKVRQLACFIPLNEKTYEEEIVHYHKYLDYIYGLCHSCHFKVREHLKKQSSWLEKETGHRLGSVDDCEPSLADTVSLRLCDTRQLNFVPSTLFALTSIVALSIVLLQLRLFLEPQYKSGEGFLHFTYDCLDSLLYAVPVKNITHLEQALLYIGSFFCILGLLAVGKNSLFIADAILVLLWLVSFLIWLAVPALCHRVRGRFQELCHQSSGVAVKLCLSLATFLIIFICIFKKRRSRNISNLHIFMKPVKALSSSESKEFTREYPLSRTGRKETRFNSSLSDEAVQSMSSSSASSPFIGHVDNVFMPISSSPLRPNSPAGCSTKAMPSRTASGDLPQENEFLPESENVRQDLETFSLGLGKRSGSSSSIWSLPSIIASASSQSPDSTQNTSEQHFSLASRGILSPSRLGFLSSDSLSPNSGKLISPRTHEPMNTSKWRDPHNKGSRSQFNDSYKNHSSQISSYNVSSSHQKFPDSQSLYNYRMQCDSTTDFPASNSKKGKRESLKEELSNTPDSGFSQSIANDETKKSPRRSQRIAMQGKIVRPWPLKKSLSLNSMYDRKNADLAGPLSRAGLQLNPSIGGNSQHWGLDHSRFEPFRPTSAFRPAVGGANSDTRLSTMGDVDDGGHYIRRRLPRRIEELSDDEEEEERFEARGSRSNELRRSLLLSASLQDAWSRWTLVFFGLIIGISVTSNAFLLWFLMGKTGNT